MSSIPSPPPDAISETMEEGPGRYVPFLARLRTALIAGTRFTAYTSEAGEALRPIVSPALVKGAYAVSWSYIIGDVGYAGWRAHQQSEALLNGEKDSEVLSNLSSAQKDELRKREINEGKMLESIEKKVEKEIGSDKHSNIIDPRIHGQFTHVGFVMARRAVFQSIARLVQGVGLAC